MDIAPVFRILGIIVTVSIIFYLTKVFVEKREKVTIILISFFVAYLLERIYAFLGELKIITGSWVVEISIGMALSATALAIPVSIMRIRELYLFPPVVGTTLIVVNMVSSYSRQLIAYLFNVIFYLTGFNIWYPTIDLINRMYFENNEYIAILANPVDTLLIPDQSYKYLYMSGILLAAPAFILFAVLTWRERSGKALGFIIGLITIAVGASVAIEEAYAPFELLGISIMALGIFGLIDKYLFKKTET